MSIRVMLIEDSAVMRKLLLSALRSDPDIEVVGSASSAEVAWSRIQRLKPDVVTLDLNQHPDDGIALMEQIMADRPIPTVILSADGRSGSRHGVAALTAGALFTVTRRPGEDASSVRMLNDLRTKIKLAALASVRPICTQPVRPVEETESPEPLEPLEANHNEHEAQKPPGPSFVTNERGPELIAIGTSTGGAAALARILPFFPPDSPPIVIVDHMPQGYTEAMARRLDADCQLDVREARDNEALSRGQARIAPGGDRHLRVVRVRNELRTSLVTSGLIDGHCPSVTELFASVASASGHRSAVALLTGMGRDGATGLLLVRKAGGFTVTQDKASSVVYGMPKAGFEIGASMAQVTLDEIPAFLQRGHTGPRPPST